MQVLGLTGGAGAGREMIASMPEECGLPVLDCDRVYRELLTPPSPLLDELFEEFGLEIITDEGTLNRHAPAMRVFDPTDGGVALSRLNAITHPHIRKAVRAHLKQLAKEYDQTGEPETVVLCGAMLYEEGLEFDCLLLFSVIAPRSKRLTRIMERTGLPEAHVRAMMQAQKTESFFRKHTGCIAFTEDEEALRHEVWGLYRTMRRYGG